MLILIPVCILIFCIVCVGAIIASIEIRYRLQEKKVAEMKSEQSNELYYFNQLTYKEQLLFKAIANSAKAYERNTEIVHYKYSENEFQRVAKALSFDCPEYFYLDKASFRLYCDNYKSYVEMDFLFSVADINNMKMEIEAVSAAGVAYATDDMTDFEKAVAIHDFLTKHCTYAGTTENPENIPSTAHTAYGALINKLAYCDGYSAAYKILLNRCGIECIIVEGKTDIEPHLWNVVKQGNDYFHIDCTWDDPDIEALSDFAFHGFFNLSDSEISKSHLIYKNFKLPNCSSTENYYSQRGAKVVSPEDFETIAYNQIKDAILKNNEYFEIYPIYTNNEEDYKESLLNAIDKVNSEYEKSILSRSYQAFNATKDGYSVTVQIYYINE
ncbi:MAG: hypothetical protein IKU45_05085 [Clostridia bacterium]|nr:hypothetical protein [Clostridia bacterium]